MEREPSGQCCHREILGGRAKSASAAKVFRTIGRWCQVSRHEHYALLQWASLRQPLCVHVRRQARVSLQYAKPRVCHVWAMDPNQHFQVQGFQRKELRWGRLACVVALKNAMVKWLKQHVTLSAKFTGGQCVRNMYRTECRDSLARAVSCNTLAQVDLQPTAPSAQK